MKSTSEILIKLRRQYKDHEVISALYKRLSEQDVELGKLNSYIQELEYNIQGLEYRERQVKNLDYQIKINKLTYKNMVLDIKKTEPYKDLLDINKNMQEIIDKLRKDRSNLIYQNNQDNE